MADVFPDKWPVLDNVRKTLNYLFREWVEKPLTAIKEGLQEVLKAVWDWPTTWKKFIAGVEKGYRFWHDKATEYARTFANNLVTWALKPFQPILVWYREFAKLVRKFFDNPWAFIWFYFERGWTVFWAWVYRHVPFLRYLLVDIPSLIKAWFTYNYDFYRRLYNDYRDRLWDFLRDPFGFIWKLVLKGLETIGSLLYVLILEFIDRIW